MTNLGLFAIQQGLAWLTAGTVAAVIVTLADRSPFARLPFTMSLPGWLRFIVAVLVLDAASYAIHLAAHHIPPWWRLHAVHHSDLALDVTTTVRHHPLDAIVTGLALGCVAGLLGLTTAEVAVYGTIATVVQLFAHADLGLPIGPMRVAGLIFVTPELHAAHHSRHRAETNSNYGQAFSLWDRMFGTLLRRREAEPIRFGLDQYAGPRFRGLSAALTQPFVRANEASSD